MKTHPLIIDLRHQLPWHRRYLSTTTTAMLWALWLFLWRPVVLALGVLSVQNPQLLHHFLAVFAQIIEHGFTALVGCAVSLWLWSNLMSSKADKYMETESSESYARYFKLEHQQLLKARQQKILTVHHDAQGQMIALSSAAQSSSNQAASAQLYSVQSASNQAASAQSASTKVITGA